MNLNIHQAGNTVRVTGSFFDWTGEAISPEIVKFMVYDDSYNRLAEFDITSENMVQTGVYYCDYVFENPGDYIYEWFSQISGSPSLLRQRVRVVTV